VQFSPSLAVLFRTLGWPHLFELAKDAGKRLSSQQKAVISDYNNLKFARACAG